MAPVPRKEGEPSPVEARTGQNLGAKPGNKKRKAAAMPRDSNNLVGAREGLGFEDSQKISPEIEKMRSELDVYVKEHGYCKENKKLRVEMDLKDEEVQCLRKQNEELKASYDELQIKYKKQIEELQAKHEKQNDKLQCKYKKLNEELQAKFEEQKEELQAMFEEQNKDLQSNYNTLVEEMQDKLVGLLKNLLSWLTMLDRR